LAGTEGEKGEKKEKRLSYAEKMKARAEQYDRAQVFALTNNSMKQGNDVAFFEQRTGKFLVNPEDEA